MAKYEYIKKDPRFKVNPSKEFNIVFQPSFYKNNYSMISKLVRKLAYEYKPYVRTAIGFKINPNRLKIKQLQQLLKQQNHEKGL